MGFVFFACRPSGTRLTYIDASKESANCFVAGILGQKKLQSTISTSEPRNVYYKEFLVPALVPNVRTMVLYLTYIRRLSALRAIIDHDGTH